MAERLAVAERLAAAARPVALLRVEDAARELSLSRSAIYRLMDAGRLRTVRIGAARRVPADAVEEFLRSLTDGSATTPGALQGPVETTRGASLGLRRPPGPPPAPGRRTTTGTPRTAAPARDSNSRP